MTLRVALVGGPMYDGLYRMLDERDVEVVVHADHPTLNREVAELLERGTRVDVLSTHSKYAPAQRKWLLPLDGAIDTSELAPRAVELCAFGGEQLCVPRNIDVRVLWADTRRLGAERIPATWAELRAREEIVFGFPGRESGLFGTFFELVVAHDGALFDIDRLPTMDTVAARHALETLVDLAARAPRTLCDWHYDEVDAALGKGLITMAAAWPGATAALRATELGPYLEPFPYLDGRSYAGCHAWAVSATTGDRAAALALVHDLCSAQANALEAQSGAVCAHVDAFAAVQPVDGIDARRRAITADTIATGMITYPPMERFPQVEDAGWSALREALRGEATIGEALVRLQRAAEAACRT